jgi:hypothetical protein
MLVQYLFGVSVGLELTTPQGLYQLLAEEEKQVSASIAKTFFFLQNHIFVFT